MRVVNNESAIKKIKSGLPIIFQTDTLPAIGCLPGFSKKIYEVKKRDFKKPLILMGASNSQLLDYVDESAKEDYEIIASKFWPGALTIIIPISKNKKSALTSRNLTLGLRVPNSNNAQALIKRTGPLLTSSANISGLQGSITAEGISIDMPNVDILGPTPWEKCSGSASTIISWAKNGKWKLVRQGEVLIQDLL